MDERIETNRTQHFVVMVVLVVAVIAGIIFAMNGLIQKTVYQERQELLENITTSCADILDYNINGGREREGLFADRVAQDMPAYSSIDDYISAVNARPDYVYQAYFFVDSAGRYYSSDGMSGKIADMTYYTATSEDSLEYLSTLPHLDSNYTYLIFRTRLSQAITIDTPKGEADISYCGILYDLGELNEALSGEFPGDNNTFIFDSNGAMLFKSQKLGNIVKGDNIYAKIEQCEYPYGEDANELEQQCRNGENIVVQIESNGSQHYFCSTSLESNDWSLAFVVQTDFIDEATGGAFANLILYIAGIAGALGIVALIAYIMIRRNRADKRAIKEINELNEALTLATNAKTKFLSNMSHDIRTPINGIMGMTTIAKGVEGNPEKTTECLNKIDSASHHLLSLINDVLDMSRIESGKTEIMEAPINLAVVCESCSSIIKGQMTGRELNFETSLEGQDLWLLGDELHLRQILINILGNAVKFTPDGGTIRFLCQEKACDAETAIFEFVIADTGMGMSQEFLQKIFDPFSQAENSSRTNYKGTGLGMSITKQLTELMGGSIEIESEEEVGSTFTVTIPFKIDPEPEKDDLVLLGTADISDVRILLVEDNELNMEIACELLEEAGAFVTMAENGQEALDAFRDNPPETFDVILMDVMMPVMNGLDATRAIRALEREDAHMIPILAMTANAFADDVRATAEAGMNGHLSKPINIDEVITTIARELKR